MERCLQLARAGAGNVAPNPMVGAVLVCDGRIIGEGYHHKYGEPHAEVNCIRHAISNGNLDKIAQSTLYVSLEPCVHFGKTPPCADLIIKHNIPTVMIGCRDPFPEVNGKGIEKLKEAGIDTRHGILEAECKQLNQRFFTFHTRHRPYIILKWAETSDGYIALAAEETGEKPEKKRLLISNEYSNRLVHKWRSEEGGILVGTNTLEHDDPELTTRLWPGHSPVRLIVDMNLRLSLSLKIFDRRARTIIFNAVKHEEAGDLLYYRVAADVSLIQQVVNALYQLNIQSVIVEGGAQMLQSFIDEDMWDEARVICNRELATGKGLPAPRLRNFSKTNEVNIFSDTIEYFKNSE